MFTRFATIGAAIGLAAPILLWLKFMLNNQMFGLIEFLIWPSSIMLIDNERYAAGDPQIYVNLGYSVLANIVWYVVLASGGYGLYRVAGKRNASRL